MIQDTAARLAGFPDATAPVVVCNESHRFLVAEQLREMGMPAASILLEPVGRNTAPAIALAAHAARQLAGDDALMLVLPADHVLQDLAAFQSSIRLAVPAASSGKLVAFGIVARSPETGYGYSRIAVDQRYTSIVLPTSPERRPTPSLPGRFPIPPQLRPTPPSSVAPASPPSADKQTRHSTRNASPVLAHVPPPRHQAVLPHTGAAVRAGDISRRCLRAAGTCRPARTKSAVRPPLSPAPRPA